MLRNQNPMGSTCPTGKSLLTSLHQAGLPDAGRLGPIPASLRVSAKGTSCKRNAWNALPKIRSDRKSPEGATCTVRAFSALRASISDYIPKLNLGLVQNAPSGQNPTGSSLQTWTHYDRTDSSLLTPKNTPIIFPLKKSY
ncbi:hypothetical protein Ataiwa_08760 [Algoriphagus taiwanensis]|uniref:Uncharacterized protein n=1 Tax=Algoriphagus taiwanensis TaxID=1445656 RepID=A0ABQ6PXE8_9BACT|nr:hypothetical protein Ataiwa_08760 [Algoriphagus taiwanensis]